MVASRLLRLGSPVRARASQLCPQLLDFAPQLDVLLLKGRGFEFRLLRLLLVEDALLALVGFELPHALFEDRDLVLPSLAGGLLSGPARGGCRSGGCARFGFGALTSWFGSRRHNPFLCGEGRHLGVSVDCDRERVAHSTEAQFQLGCSVALVLIAPSAATCSPAAPESLALAVSGGVRPGMTASTRVGRSMPRPCG